MAIALFDRDYAMDKKPRVAVVGAGYWGKNLVRNFAELGALAAIVDHNDDVAQALAQQHGCNIANYDAVLNDKSIDAVVIATPAPSHFAHGLAALKAGKHVYIEKPLAMRADHAAQLVEHAHAAGVTLMVGHILRHHPAFVALEAQVAAGRIGLVRHVVATRLNLGKIHRDEGVIWDLAPHDISMVMAFLGDTPEQVICLGDDFLYPHIVDVALLRLRYAHGRSAEIRLSRISPYKEHKLTVIGENGALIFDDTQNWDNKILLRQPVLDWQNPAVSPEAGVSEVLPLPAGEPLKEECRQFLDAIATKTPTRSDGQQGLAVVLVLERAMASWKAGGTAQ